MQELTEKEEKYVFEIQKIVQEGFTREEAYKIQKLVKKKRHELKKAVWQYLIDHTTIQKNGYMGVQLYYKDNNDLWKRIHAREQGKFKRYDVIKKEILASRKWAKVDKKNFGIKHGLAKDGNPIQKIVIYLYEKFVQKV